MTNSILNTIKRMIGALPDYEAFDTELIVHINSAIMALTQIGVGPEEGFYISDENQTWEDFLGERKDIEAVKQYIFAKVKIAFDTNMSSVTLAAFQEIVKETEFRISVNVDRPVQEVSEENE